MIDTKEARELLAEFMSSRPDSCPPESADPSNRYYLNARRAAAALHWRLGALAEASISCLDANQNLAATVLARAAFETAAVIHYVEESVAAARKGADVQEEDKKLTRVYLGRKDKIWKPDLSDEHLAVNVVTCIQRVDKRFNTDALQFMYEEASEYSHPNWLGTIGLFKRAADAGNDAFDLTSDAGDEHSAQAAVSILSVALRIGITFLQLAYKQTLPRTDGGAGGARS